MEMVGHNHEAVKQIFLLLAVVKKDIDKQIGGERSREYGFALGGHRSDEKCAVHPCRVMQAEEEKCERDHAETGRLLGSRETGPKASYEKAERGPEGPLFHGARMDGWRIGVCNPSLRRRGSRPSRIMLWPCEPRARQPAATSRARSICPGISNLRRTHQ
jgi:hypothetical protein